MKEKKTIKQLIVVISLIGLALVGLGTFFMVKDLKHKKESYKVTLYISLQMTKMHIPAVVRRRMPIKIIRII